MKAIINIDGPTPAAINAVAVNIIKVLNTSVADAVKIKALEVLQVAGICQTTINNCTFTGGKS